MNGMTGPVAPNAVLVVRKAGEQQLEYLRLTMKNVTITSYQTGGSGGEDRLTENVVLHFGSMQGQYVQQKPDGSSGPPITFAGTAVRQFPSNSFCTFPKAKPGSVWTSTVNTPLPLR
jgi:type VI secretion system secreted protein Hcp